MNKEHVIRDLKKIVGESNIKIDEPMKDYTSFKVGGPADVLIEPKNKSELVDTIRYINNFEIPNIIIGNGSNTIVRDGGFRGIVVVIGQSLNDYSIEGTTVSADSGILLSTLAKNVANAGLTGMEPMSGIPGSLGGAVFMNAGAYGGEMKDVVVSANAYDPTKDQIVNIMIDEMNLGYRTSEFQSNGMIILDVTLELKTGDPDEIKSQMRELNKKRNAKQPVNMPSAGSFFKRPEGHYAGGIIEEAGLKGLKKGGAQISDLHAGFMVNAGNATFRDIEDLMQIVRATVFDKSGIMLEPEVRFVGDANKPNLERFVWSSRDEVEIIDED